MSRTMRFHLDENSSSRKLINGLRQRGIDVTTTSDAGLVAANDEAQLDFAMSDRRVLITQDSDFCAMHSSGAIHCGIIYSPKDRRSNRELLAAIILIWEIYEPDELLGILEFV